MYPPQEHVFDTGGEARGADCKVDAFQLKAMGPKHESPKYNYQYYAHHDADPIMWCRSAGYCTTHEAIEDAGSP